MPSTPDDTADADDQQLPRIPSVPLPPTHHDAPTVAPGTSGVRILTPQDYLAFRRQRGRERMAQGNTQQRAAQPQPIADDDDDDETPPDAAG